METSDDDPFAIPPRWPLPRPATGDEAVGRGAPIAERRAHAVRGAGALEWRVSTWCCHGGNAAEG